MRYLVFVFVFALSLSGYGNASEIAPRDGWQILTTQHGYDQLVDRVKAAVKAEGMLLVTQASASAGAKGRGLTIPGNRIMGVYRNDYALRMLEASVAAGIEAPIRFYVTENTDGTATLSWKTPSFVFAPYMGEGGEELSELARELDGVFQTIANRAVAAE